MIGRKKPSLPSHLPAQPAKQLSQPASSPSVQPKTAPPATIVRKGVTPQAYRPQPTPRVLQKKSVRSLQAQTACSGSKPVAPPVYRPQLVPKVLQTKIHAPGQPPSPSKGAPVYRPLPTPRVLQRKSAIASQLLSDQSRRQPIAPIQLNPGVLQQKKLHTSPPASQPRPVPKTSLSGAIPRQLSPPGHNQRGLNPVIQRTITVAVKGKTIRIMSENDADNATGLRVDARDLNEPICGQNIEKKVANDTRDYEKVQGHANEIAQALQKTDSVTVFCKKGQHRSVTSVILYLMNHEKLNFEEAKGLIDSADKTSGHEVGWDQVTRSLENIRNYPNRREASQRHPIVSNNNPVASNSKPVVSNSNLVVTNTASSNGLRIRESEVEEVKEQAERWRKRGEKSPRFWPDFSG